MKKEELEVSIKCIDEKPKIKSYILIECSTLTDDEMDEIAEVAMQTAIDYDQGRFSDSIDSANYLHLTKKQFTELLALTETNQSKNNGALS